MIILPIKVGDKKKLKSNNKQSSTMLYQSASPYHLAPLMCDGMAESEIQTKLESIL